MITPHGKPGRVVTDPPRASVGIDAQPVPAVDRLRGEGLVELPQVDVLDLEAVPLQQSGNGEDLWRHAVTALAGAGPRTKFTGFTEDHRPGRVDPHG